MRRCRGSSLACVLALAACTEDEGTRGGQAEAPGPGADAGTPDANARRDVATDARPAADSAVPVDAERDAGDDARDARPDAGPIEPLQLWLYLRPNLQVDARVEETLALVDRAVAAGYTGIALQDFKFSLVHTGGLIERYPDNVRRVIARVQELGLDLAVGLFPFGYSEGILRADPNLAEGQPVREASFVVTDEGDRAVLAHRPVGFANRGFEEHDGDTFSGWDWHDDPGVRTFADRDVFRSGAVSARIDPGEGNARLVQGVEVRPYTQYHVGFWMKTEDAESDWQAAMLLDQDGRRRSFFELEYAPTQDWTRYDLVANSMDSTELRLYIGLWGRSNGQAWFDDVSFQDVGLVNVLRRPGAPLRVYTAGGQELEEGADVARIVDPLAGANGSFDEWHAPPTVGIPQGSMLISGATFFVDYYAVSPVHNWQVGVCLSEPAVRDWMVANFAALHDLFPPGTGWFLQHDEMRHMNTCGACTARGLDAGALLADNVRSAVGVIRALRPDAPLYVWSDMFDPHHNAHGDYYLVEGDVAGSWEGLPPELVLMNWNGGKRSESLTFFAGRGHRQLIAGYYDSGDGAASAEAELATAQGTSGFQGLMYTTWRADYSQLEAYAAAALSR